MSKFKLRTNNVVLGSNVFGSNPFGHTMGTLDDDDKEEEEEEDDAPP